MLTHILVIILILLSGIFFNNSKFRFGNKVYMINVFLVLFFISAFRSVNIGNDTQDYFLMFYRFGNMNSVFNLDSTIEIGYRILNRALYTISSNTLILTTVTSAIIIGVFMKFIYKNSKITWLSVLLFLNLRIFYFTLSGIRQSIALAVILVSYKYVKERKFIPFFILVIVASTFHLTALVFLIVYPLSKINYTKKVMNTYLVISGLLFLLFDYFIIFILRFFPKYQVYISSSYFENTRLASMVDFFVILSIFVFGYILRKNFNNNEVRIKRKSKKTMIKNKYATEKNILLHIISLALLFTFIAINVSLVKRVGLYFFIFTIIYIPNVIQKIQDKNLKLLLLYSITVLTFAYNIIILIYRPEWQHVYPYEFFWQIN
ncbi:EpsG family protein [Amphibacillus sp. Q70]|uniref:EpsG family protein n=1 Tax=Amphibacillus sp. Q70 TaxID=3453416 RepID=UPI003F839943